MVFKIFEKDIVEAFQEKYGKSIMSRKIVAVCDAGLDTNRMEYYLELELEEPSAATDTVVDEDELPAPSEDPFKE